jgi:hypothetical protein
VGASEILVSGTVKDLTAGSRLSFGDAGEHALKGVGEDWRLYRVGRNLASAQQSEPQAWLTVVQSGALRNDVPELVGYSRGRARQSLEGLVWRRA